MLYSTYRHIIYTHVLCIIDVPDSLQFVDGPTPAAGSHRCVVSKRGSTTGGTKVGRTSWWFEMVRMIILGILGDSDEIWGFWRKSWFLKVKCVFFVKKRTTPNPKGIIATIKIQQMVPSLITRNKLVTRVQTTVLLFEKMRLWQNHPNEQVKCGTKR